MKHREGPQVIAAGSLTPPTGRKLAARLRAALHFEGLYPQDALQAAGQTVRFKAP
jgi:hypothetical protein